MKALLCKEITEVLGVIWLIMSECLDACYNLFHTFDILLIALIMARLYSSGTLRHENVIVTQRQLIITYENCFCILELVTGCNSHIFKISG